MGRRGCASAMGMIKFPSSCSSPKALCNQFIDYYICSRGVFCINHIKFRNFVVITIECSIATVDRGSIMTRIYRWSMMVYSSLQAEFMVTKYDNDVNNNNNNKEKRPSFLFGLTMLGSCNERDTRISACILSLYGVTNLNWVKTALVLTKSWARGENITYVTLFLESVILVFIFYVPWPKYLVLLVRH